MSALTARAKAGRLVLDVPTDLPDGAVVQLVPLDTWDDLDDDERVALEADLDASEEDFQAGRYEPLADIIAALRQQR